MTLLLLEKGLERVKKGWCQGVFCRNENGSIANLGADTAASWCPVGAIDDISAARIELQITLGIENIAKWNDRKCRTQADVIALYEKTIARLKAETRGER